MIPFVFLCLLCICISAVSPQSYDPKRDSADFDVVPDAFIVEFEGDHSVDVFYHEIESDLGFALRPRLALTYRLFNGASFTITDPSDSRAAAAEIAKHPIVKNIWPVRQFAPPQDEFDFTPRSPIRKRDLTTRQSFVNDTYAPHVMTQVDLLHAAGFTGQGVKIGVIDTGVDYSHPDLGACFGPGCTISYGYNFVDNNQDPMDDCHGHGTHVVGIISARPNAMGFLGIAPDAEVGMYQVSSCSGSVTTDTYIAAFNQAAEDGSDVISASMGSGGGWPDDAYPLALERIVDSGVPVVVSSANNGAAGMFRPTNPAAGRGVASIASVDPSMNPYLDLVASYTTHLSESNDLVWIAGMPPMENLSLPLYHLGAQNSSNRTTDGCSPLDGNVPSLKDFVVLVEVGSCGLRAQVVNIVARGGEHIMFIGTNDR